MLFKEAGDDNEYTISSEELREQFELMMQYSFVIPTYNNHLLLQKTLEALNNQRIEFQGKYEVIVVDDGSDDNAYHHIRNIPHNYNLRYHYLPRDENSCRAKARNTGWKSALGEIIIFLDADIITNENYLYELEKSFRHTKDIILFGTRIMIPSPVDMEDVKTKRVFEKYRFDGANPELWEVRHRIFDFLSYNMNCYQYPWIFAHTSNLAVSKEWLQYINGFDEGFKGWGHEDIELGLRLYREKVKIILNKNLEVWHQYHKSDIRGAGDNTISHDFDLNCRYFLNKYPGLFELSYEEALEVLRGNKIIDIRNKDCHFSGDRNIQPYIMELKNPGDMDALKEELKYIDVEEKKEIIIYDHIDNSDLHLWIQCVEGNICIPGYFPVSKGLFNNTPLVTVR